MDGRTGEWAIGQTPELEPQTDYLTLLRSPDQWSRPIALAVLGGGFCGMIGPFGTYPANIFNRMAFWIGLFVAGILLLRPINLHALHKAKRHGYPPALLLGIALVAGCMPLAMLAAIGGHLLWPVRASTIRALEWYGQTVLLAVPVGLALLRLELGSRSSAVLPTPKHRVENVIDAPVLADLSQALLLDALCLQMEDHHVRIHGRRGSRLALATLRDAVRLTGDGRGLQVHRSWWVARDAVVGIHDDARSIRLTLSNGLEVPVARNRVALLRAEGWLRA